MWCLLKITQEIAAFVIREEKNFEPQTCFRLHILFSVYEYLGHIESFEELNFMQIFLL